ncbi:MAG: S-adenosylmethionine:tRNA ribosyltransferase-isomerase [Bacilli bacterium]
MSSLTANELTLTASPAAKPAVSPAEWRRQGRDDVSLLVIDGATNSIFHRRFAQLASCLHAGDLVVVNTSGTMAAALPAHFHGAPLRLHIAVELPDGAYVVERRGANGEPDPTPFASGDRVQVGGCDVAVVGAYHPRSRLWIVRAPQPLWHLARQLGEPIRYGYVKASVPIADYQTIFARVPGSAEMPSAGRPFTHRNLRELARRGVQIRSLTLHTGLSSHEVQGRLDDHPVLPEWYDIPEATAAAVRTARREGRRIVAVGTTVVRALEGMWSERREIGGCSGWTRHLVTPDAPPQIVSALVTGMHDNHTSHLALLLSFAERTLLERGYAQAIERGYEWHEFGDVSLVIRAGSANPD